MKQNRRSIFVLYGCLYSVGCTHQVRPDDMSAEAHHATAARETRQAQREMGTSTLESPARSLDQGLEPVLYINPDATPDLAYDRVAHARHLAERAREHEQAAAELERSEEVECKAVPPAKRGACPLLGPISDIRDIDGGARVLLGGGTRASVVLPGIRCHYAHARAHGWTGNSDCALDIRGIEFRETSDLSAFEIIGHDGNATAEARKRIHAVALGRAMAIKR
jgi:hypothetical protein